MGKGTSAKVALAKAPGDAYDGSDMNAALWSGRKNLTGKEAIRKAARQVLARSMNMKKKLGGIGGLSSSTMIARVAMAAKDQDRRFNSSENSEREEILRTSEAAGSPAEADANDSRQ